MLDAGRKEINGQVSNMGPAKFNSTQLNVLKQQMDGLMEKFSADTTSVVESYEDQAFSLGDDTVSDPLAAVGLEGATMGHISESSLKIAQAYTADLITGLSKDAAARINAAIQ